MQSRAAPISKVESHISDWCSHNTEELFIASVKVISYSVNIADIAQCKSTTPFFYDCLFTLMKQPSGKRTALNVNSSTSFSIRHRRIKET